MLKRKLFSKNLFIYPLILILGSILGFQYASGRFGTLPYLPEPIVNKTAIPSKLVNTFQDAQFKDIDFQLFWEVWRLLDSQYVNTDKLDAEQMLDGAVSGLAGSLGDPYTFYLPPEEKQRTQEDLQGSFYGVGIQLGYVDQTLAVVSPLRNSPAEKAGIQAGDLILHVRDTSQQLDEDTTGWTLNEAVDKIRGKRGTEVTLTMFRKDNGAEPYEVILKRDKISVPSVELQKLGDGIENSQERATYGNVVSEETVRALSGNNKEVAYIRISTFNEQTKKEWDEAVDKILADKNIKAIIVDFRNNPGGLLDRAIELSSDFIGSGLIVTQKGRYTDHPFNSLGTARLKNYPVVVLVNKGSASASEIMAGALRDQLGVKLIGEKTFGKGTVQDRKELTNGGALHVTIAKWLLPSGSWIHEEGIPVDIEIKDNYDTPEDEVILRAVEEL